MSPNDDANIMKVVSTFYLRQCITIYLFKRNSAVFFSRIMSSIGDKKSAKTIS